jgi:hypothetical protein
MTAVQNDNLNNNNIPRVGGRVLRFEFSGALVEHVTAFANLHQYDDRKMYKEAWTAWLAHDEIATLLANEVTRLSALGYMGDVADKLFKSGRYYFRQKTCGFPNLSLHAEPLCPNLSLQPVGVRGAQRHGRAVGTSAPRKYVLLNHQLLDAMDDHIDCGLRRDAYAYTPASGFAEFCKLNINSYSSEVARLSEIMPTGEAVHDKIKKTYKNRYFMMTKPGRQPGRQTQTQTIDLVD